ANLCIADIFKSSVKYKDASTKAISIVAYFTDSRHSHWITEINYKYTIEVAKSLEQNILTNINNIFGSDNHRHKQLNFHNIEQESSDVIDLESSDIIDLESSDIIELETNKNKEIIIENNSELSVNKDISEE
ncbi:5204_t:CDS:2, partial [Scutellospora calospora]